MRELTIILEQDVHSRDAHAEARMALRHLSELEGIAGRVKSLDEELGRARASLEHQQAVRAEAEELSQPGEPLMSSRDVSDGLRKAEADVRAIEEQARNEDSRADECRRAQQDLQGKERELQIRSTRWRELDTVASRLEATLGTGLRTAQELEAARQVLDEERDDLQRRLEGLQNARAETKDRARNLEQTGGVFHRDLLACSRHRRGRTAGYPF